MVLLSTSNCARSESRTDRIARALLERLGGLQEEVKLAEMDLQPLSEERLNRRTRLIEKADYTDAMFDLARQFQQADDVDHSYCAPGKVLLSQKIAIFDLDAAFAIRPIVKENSSDSN